MLIGGRLITGHFCNKSKFTMPSWLINGGPIEKQREDKRENMLIDIFHKIIDVLFCLIAIMSG